MPYFPAVGHIDDNLTPEEVKKEYRRRYSLASYHRRRIEIVAALGGKCVYCDAGEPLTLVRRADSPVFRVGALVNMTAARRAEFLPHVELMCADHAQKVIYHKGRVTHGTWWSAFKKKCRCDDCQEFRFDYNLRRKEDRRDANA